MDTSRFHPNRPKFAVLDLLAGFGLKMATSVGFHLGHSRPNGLFVVGLLEVHHPREDHVKARLTVLLPSASLTVCPDVVLCQAAGARRETVQRPEASPAPEASRGGD